MQTQKFVHKPLYVEAVRVNASNFYEVASWCNGTTSTDDDNRAFIQVPVVRAVKPRPHRAFYGDWVVLTGGGFKVFKTNAFCKTFNPIAKTKIQNNPPDLERNVDRNETKLSLEVLPQSDPAAVRLLEEVFSSDPTPALGIQEIALKVGGEPVNFDISVEQDVSGGANIDPAKFREMLAARAPGINTNRQRAGINKL